MRTWRRYSTAIRALALLAGLGLPPASGRIVAQDADAPGGATLTGRILSAETGEPVVGALVRLEAMDRTTLSDPSGRYTLRDLPAGDHRVVIERIGFETERVRATVAANRTVRLDIAIAVSPVSLEGIAVEGAPRCRTLPAEGLAVARVWAEARKALTATVLTEREPYRYRTVGYTRKIDPKTGWPSEEERRTRTGFFEQPFRSIPVERLVRHGFVERTDSATFYHAPDARALLSDAFLETHCFRLRTADDDGETVGLAFEPVPGRRLPEVGGMLWLDRRTAALRRLEYSYRNLHPDVGSDRLGGDVDFERLPNGTWIVRRWSIRMPVVGIQRDHVLSDGRRRRVLIAIAEEGGEVLEIRAVDGDVVRSQRGDATRASLAVSSAGRVASLRSDAAADSPESRGNAASGAPRGSREGGGDVAGAVAGPRSSAPRSVIGRVLERGTETPIEGALVALDHDGRRAVTDSLGRFALRDVAAGGHTLRIEHIAYGTRTAALTVPAGENLVEIVVWVERRVIALEPIDVDVLSDVERTRRAQGHSHHLFLTREDLDRYEARGALNVGEALKMHDPLAVNVRPAAVGPNDLGLCVESTRASHRPSPGRAMDPIPHAQIGRGATRAKLALVCAAPLVVLDGARLFAAEVGMTLEEMRPALLERVELLPPSEAALRYGTLAANGALVIETRHGGGLLADESDLTTEELLERIREPGPKRWHYPALGGLLGVLGGAAYLGYTGNNFWADCGPAGCGVGEVFRPFAPFIAGVGAGVLAGEIVFRIGVGGPEPR